MAGTPMAKGMAIPAASRPRKIDHDEEDFEARRSRDEASGRRSTIAWPSTISSSVAPTTITVSGIHSGVPSAVLACASRR